MWNLKREKDWILNISQKYFISKKYIYPIWHFLIFFYDAYLKIRCLYFQTSAYSPCCYCCFFFCDQKHKRRQAIVACAYAKLQCPCCYCFCWDFFLCLVFVKLLLLLLLLAVVRNVSAGKRSLPSIMLELECPCCCWFCWDHFNLFETKGNIESQHRMTSSSPKIKTKRPKQNLLVLFVWKYEGSLISQWVFEFAVHKNSRKLNKF